MSVSKMKIGGETVELDSADLEFSAATIDDDMEEVAALIGNCGELWAAAEEQAMNMDTVYRAWRGDAGAQMLAKDPKLAEWKVNQALDSLPEFSTYKQAMARAKKVALTLKNRFIALDKKASAIQSRGAMLRKELDSTGMTTPMEERKKKVKAILGD